METGKRSPGAGAGSSSSRTRTSANGRAAFLPGYASWSGTGRQNPDADAGSPTCRLLHYRCVTAGLAASRPCFVLSEGTDKPTLDANAVATCVPVDPDA